MGFGNGGPRDGDSFVAEARQLVPWNTGVRRQQDNCSRNTGSTGFGAVSPQIAARLVEALTGRRPRGSTSPIEKLSDREFEVFQLIGQGDSRNH